MGRCLAIVTLLAAVLVGAPAPSAIAATPVPAPTGLTATATSAREVRLTWSPGDGATSYAISVVADDGSESPATVLDIGDRGATVRTQASTRYIFRVRGVAGELVSLGLATVEVTTPAREPSVVNLAVPRPVPDGHTVLTFRVEGTQTLQPTSGTLEVSINGGPTAQVEVGRRTVPAALVQPAWAIPERHGGRGRHRRRPGGNRSRGPGRPRGHHRALRHGWPAPCDGSCDLLAAPRGGHRRRRRDTVRDIVSVDFFNGFIGVSLTWDGPPQRSSTWGTIRSCSACATWSLPM